MKNYYLKIQQCKSFVKREFQYSDLKDFNIMNAKIINAISFIETKIVDILNDYFPIIILNHPELNNIYIYCKEQWDLYYKYNIIEECINNRTLKMKSILKLKKDEKLLSSTKIMIENRNIIMKYILKRLPLDLYLNSLLNFLKENQEIMKNFIKYFINEIINNDISSTPNIVDDNLDENINIDSIINNGENKKNINKKKDMEISAQYYLHKKAFISALDERFKTFSKNQKSFEEIIKTFKENDNKLSDLDIKETYVHQTNLKLNNNQSLGRITLSNNDKDDNYKNILCTVLNPPHQYVQNLMNNDKYFKKFNKYEYYNGFEVYKDELNRKYMNIFINNS